MKKLTLGFAGTPSFGLSALKALSASSHELKAVYTQPDRPAGRGRKLQASPIKAFAIEHHLPVYQPLHFKNDEDIETLKSLELDVLVVIAYGLLLPTRILDIPRYGCINVHASLLPRWRGASPIQQSLLHGDTETGITIMQMDKGMDTGDILTMKSIPIVPQETTETLHDKLAELAVQPLLDTLNAIATEDIIAIPQPSFGITYAPKLTKEEAHIDWKQSAEVIDRQIRAYHPWPIAYSFLENALIRIHAAQKKEVEVNAPPGTIVALHKTALVIATQKGLIEITHLQSPGGKILSAHQWLQAHQNIHVGMQLL